MSYILDALRKSEQERQRSVAPNLLTVHTISEVNTQPRFFIYGSMAVSLIGAGVMIGWLHPWQREPPRSVVESITATPPGAKPRHSIPAPRPALPEMAMQYVPTKTVPKAMPVGKPVPAPKVVNLKQHTQLLIKTPIPSRKLPPQTVATIPKELATSRHETATAPVQVKAITPIPRTLTSAATPDTSQEAQKVIPMAELPLAIQQEIPEMSIPIHTYSSTPKERIVGINGRLLQEGDYLSPGLRLEKITPDGIIFSYKKYLISRGLQ